MAHPLPSNWKGGRPKGSQNKRTVAFLEVLERNDFCPAEALIECYLEAKKTYDNYAVIHAAITQARENQNQVDGSCASPTEDKAHIYLKIAMEAAKDLATYAFPKLKAVEQHKVKATDAMTAEQQLEAAKMIVRVLEQEVKSGTPGSGSS